MDSTDTSGDEDEGSRARLVPYFSIALAKLFSLHFLNIYVVSFFPVSERMREKQIQHVGKPRISQQIGN
jgi:hypothetical protein